MLNNIYSFLGLAMKAGKLLSGESSCERAIRSRIVYLVIVADDASQNTKKKFTDMCSYRGVEIKFFGKKSQREDPGSWGEIPSSGNKPFKQAPHVFATTPHSRRP